MKKFTCLICAAISAIVIFIAASCSASPVEVESVTLKETESLFIGASVQLTPEILPANASNKKLIWESSDNSIATVNSDGLVKGLKKGTTTITATASNGVSDSCELTVEDIRINNITLNITSTQTLYVNETLQIETEITPVNATDKSLTYRSSDTEVAEVDNNGLVTAKNVGSTTISVSAVNFQNLGNGSGYRSFELIVKDKPYPVIDLSNGGADFSNETNTCAAYPGYVGKLTATMSDETSSTYTWSTSDSSIVDVDNEGNVTYKGIQENYRDFSSATITCTSANGETASITCRSSFTNEFMFSDTSWLKFNNTFSRKTDESFSLNLYFYCSTSGCHRIPGNSALTITSSDESIAKVETPHPTSNSSSALITTTETAGETEITITLNSYTKKFTIKTSDIKNIYLDSTNIELAVNQTEQLTATINPESAVNKNVIWNSSNEDVATVSDTGLVTAKGVGTAIITATADADSSKTSSCNVTVREKPFPVVDYDLIRKGSVDSNNNEISCYPGAQIKVPVRMNDGSSSGFTYTCDNPEYFDVSNDGTITFKGNANISNTMGFVEMGTLTITSVLTGESLEVTVKTSIYNFIHNDGWYNYGTTFNIKAGQYIELRAMYNSVTSSGGCNGILFEDYTATSSDSSIATVSAGESDQYARITGVKSGQVTITFKIDNMTKFFYVNVSE